MYKYGLTNYKIMSMMIKSKLKFLLIIPILVGIIYFGTSVTDFDILESMDSQKWILEQLKEVVDSTEILKDTNYKDMLMRYTQSIPINLPVYNVSEQTGPDHKKLFTIKVYLEKDGDSVYYGEGTAKIKKQAEQLAAQMALDKLDVFSKISETI